MLRPVLIGLALGVATSIPIGVANLAVVDAARRIGLRRGVGIALGAATADGIHALLACAGIAPLVGREPVAELALTAVATALLVGYGIAVLRAPPAPLGTTGPATGAAPVGALGGFGVGLVLTLFNPAALGAWVAVAGALFPGISAAGGALAAAGVATGSAAWFVLLAAAVHRGRRAGGERSAWIGRAVGLGLIAIGGYFAYRAARLAVELLG